MLNMLDALDRLVRGDAPPERAPVAPQTPFEPTGPAGPRAREIADAIGLLDARSAPAPMTVMGRLGLPIQLVTEVPRSPGPMVTVSLPDEAERFLASRKAREKAALAEVAGRYRGLSASDPRVYRDQPVEGRAVQDRFQFDDAAVETESAYNAAVAVETAWADTVARLRALYPDAGAE